MRLLLRLYPRRWRERYGEELEEILARERHTPRLVLDVLAGALDAWLHPLVPSRPVPTKAGAAGGVATIGGVAFRCAGSVALTRAEAHKAIMALLGVTIVLPLAAVAVRDAFGDGLIVEALNIGAFPIGLAAWGAAGELKNHSWTTRAVLIALVAVLVFLGAWLAQVT